MYLYQYSNFIQKTRYTQKILKKKILFSRNIFFYKTQFNVFLARALQTNTFLRLAGLLEILFRENKNVIFIDYNYNYNYLPLDNKILFKRSLKNLSRIKIFFDISLVFFFNIQNKHYTFCKYKKNLITVGLKKENNTHLFDILIDLPCNNVYYYMLYLLTMNTYMKYH